MKKILFGIATLLVLICLEARAETLADYVNTCEQQLGFQGSDIPTNLNCTKGVLFAPNTSGTKTNDYFGFVRLRDNVDLTFACRWLNNGTGVNQSVTPPFVIARSVEMIINNRQNGNTCFFEAKLQPVHVQDSSIPEAVPVAIVSPAVAAAAAPGTSDAIFWSSPLELNNSIQCVDCHIAGPYITTPRIAPFMAQFGLLNNRHDTFGLQTDSNGNVIGNYHAVGTTFVQFNDLAATSNAVGGCANGCHNIGEGGRMNDITLGDGQGGKFVLIPSILNVIDSAGVETPDISVITSGVMPPYADASDYRWINLDTPGDGIETENFADALNAAGTTAPQLLSNCPAPGNLEAHVAGLNAQYAFSTSQLSQLPNRLRAFNLKDGLVCINSDQEAGQSCHDYATRYLCSVSNLDGTATWSRWYNTDSPSGDGDHEERTRDQNICGGSAPFAIQAQVTANGNTITVMGPNDRLARLSSYGLTCNNADQPDGQCSNYVVRYSACTPVRKQYSAHASSVWSNMQLTATSTANSAPTRGQPFTSSWNTQQWSIEPVMNTEYVRFRDTGTNTYLNVTTQSSGASVVTYALNTSWLSEEWTIEPISGSNSVRVKNLWSGMYLTIADTSNFAAIYSQPLNTSWLSQEWLIQ